jgi:hypothetical protein
MNSSSRISYVVPVPDILGKNIPIQFPIVVKLFVNLGRGKIKIKAIIENQPTTINIRFRTLGSEFVVAFLLSLSLFYDPSFHSSNHFH